MTQRNQQLAHLFHEIASIYRFLGEENRFRAIAYENASRTLHGLPEDISYYVRQDTLDDIPGIGKSLEKEITEYNKTGHILRFEKLKRRVPFDLMELMDVRGFGPQSLKTIYKKLHFESKDEVVQALQDGTIGKLKGFGAKKVEGMLRSLKVHKTVEERMLLWDAWQLGKEIISALKKNPAIRQVELAGSLRRKAETIGDFDILIAAHPRERKSVIEFLTAQRFAKRILAKGDTRVSVLLKASGKQCDFRIVDEQEWGSALQYFTGSKKHNIHLRSIARRKGYKISEYGIFRLKGNKRLAAKTEEEIYSILGMQLMPPEMREDRGEIELGIGHKVPALVELTDIRGDLHMHSKWSDGRLSLEDLVEFVRSISVMNTSQ